MKIEEILQLVDSVSKSGLTEFKYEEGAVKLSLKRTTGVASTAVEPSMTTALAAPAVQQVVASSEMTETVSETTATKEIADGNIVKCPLVGTFYAAPSEDAAPFIKVGDSVKTGQILAIVEAMKLMNDIESDFSGTVVDVLVENGETVEYGQPLFVIK